MTTSGLVLRMCKVNVKLILNLAAHYLFLHIKKPTKGKNWGTKYCLHKALIDDRQIYEKSSWFLTAALFWFIIFSSRSFYSSMFMNFIQIISCLSWPTGFTMGASNEVVYLCYGVGPNTGIWQWHFCSWLCLVHVQATICRETGPLEFCAEDQQAPDETWAVK